MSLSDDSSFSRWLTTGQLMQAWSAFDEQGLIDCAVALREAERYYHRSHAAGLKSDDLIRLAGYVATLGESRIALDRVRHLSKAWKQPGIASFLAEQVKGGEGKAMDVADSGGLGGGSESASRRAKVRDRFLAGLYAALGETRPQDDADTDTSTDASGAGVHIPEAVRDIAKLLERATDNGSRFQTSGGLRPLVDGRGNSGNFQLPANARNGVLFRNFSPNERRIQFTAEGSWTHYPPAGWYGPTGLPGSSASDDAMLPGRPAGGLIMLRAGPGHFEWVGGSTQIVMPAYGTVKFFCNDTYTGFGDNRGGMNIRWAFVIGGGIFG